MKTKLLKRAKKFRFFVDSTSCGEKFYALGAILGLWACVLWIFSERYAVFTALFALLIFVSGLVCETLSFIMKMWENKYSKIIISLVIAAGSTLTVAFSASIIADIVGSDPSKFQYSIALVSLLLIPFTTWLVLVVLSIISTALLVMLIPFAWMYTQTVASPVFRYAFRLKKKPRKERYFWLMVFVRCLAIGLLFGSVQSWKYFEKSYGDFVINTAEKFIYHTELYSKTYCTKLNEKEKIGYINAKDIVVGESTDTGYKFTVRACKLNNSH